MFTGIIEEIGEIISIENNHTSNYTFSVRSGLSDTLSVNQSVAHDGVCLTVIESNNEFHKVVVIEETLKKSTLSKLSIGSKVNLERCMKISDRLDGHIVQGHVDTIANCEKIEQKNGSHVFHFSYSPKNFYTVEKGSIAVNGVSLTVVDSKTGSFSVAIIPYTYTHTKFQFLQVGQKVNLEFDILGKYIYSIQYENRRIES